MFLLIRFYLFSLGSHERKTGNRNWRKVIAPVNEPKHGQLAKYPATTYFCKYSVSTHQWHLKVVIEHGKAFFSFGCLLQFFVSFGCLL
jgi:hypothetical protein